jgi:hypothetical protein
MLRFGTHSSSNTRMFERQVPCLLKRCDGKLACYAWEILQKLIKRIAAFEIVQEGLKRHASSGKAGRAPIISALLEMVTFVDFKIPRAVGAATCGSNVLLRPIIASAAASILTCARIDATPNLRGSARISLSTRERYRGRPVMLRSAVALTYRPQPVASPEMRARVLRWCRHRHRPHGIPIAHRRGCLSIRAPRAPRHHP